MYLQMYSLIWGSKVVMIVSTEFLAFSATFDKTPVDRASLKKSMNPPDDDVSFC